MATGTRIRSNFVEGVLSVTLGDNAGGTDTSITSDGFADLPVIDHATTSEYAVITIGGEIVHITTHLSAATTVTGQRAQEGSVAAAHEAGSPWEHGPTVEDFAVAAPSGSSVSSVYADRTAGNVIIPSTGWVDVDVALDLTLPAVTGDTIEAAVSALWDANGTEWSRMDAVTRVAATDTTYISGNGATGLGVMAWFAASGALVASSGSVLYTLAASDIDAGNVTLRLKARTAGTATRTVRATANERLRFMLKNLGQ